MARGMRRVTLPWRGLGLSSNLDVTVPPNPYRLLEAEPGLFDFVEYSAPLALEQARQEASLFGELWARREEVPVLLHPVHLNLWGPELESPEALRALDAHARAVGSAWVGNDVGWWHAGGQAFPGYLFIPPPLDEAGLADARAHAEHVQAHLSVPLVLENPPVLAWRGRMHVLDFMGHLHAATRAPLLVDVGHLWSFQLAAGLPPTTAFDGFPWDAVVELHLAGGVVTRRAGRSVYVDDHTQPVREELFALLEELLPRCRSLRAVTFEGDGHPPDVAALTLRRLRRLVPPGRRPDAELPRVEGRPGAYVPRVDAWALFTEVHGALGPADDPEGARAEQDYRLAVLAEVLDAARPLTRLLVAGSREGLARFALSAEYRACFEEPAAGGRGLGAALAAHARRLLKSRPEPEAEALAPVLAFETALEHATQHLPPPPQDGEVGLSPDVRVLRFPVDLSELVFAARALRSHLTRRGWATGEVEHSALSALPQVAARAVHTPWTAVAVRRGHAWEVVSAGREQATALSAAAAGLPLTQLEAVAPADTWRELRRRGWLRLGGDAR